MIYLDNAASTKPKQEVIDVLVETMQNNYANPDAIHEFSYEIAKKIKASRKVVGDFLGVPAERIFFTAGGGDGNNLILQGIIDANKKTKKHIITTTIEHPTVYEIFKDCENKGFDVDYLDVCHDGYINLDQLKEVLREDTMLVSIGAVNSETGAIQDLEKIAKIIKEKNKEIYFHTDFVQGLGSVDIKFDRIPVDAVTVSGHKIYAPKGVGAIYLKETVKINNIIKGANPANGIVKRTMPTELILAFTKAVELLDKNYKKDIEHAKKLKERLIKKIEENIENVKINSLLDEKKSSSKILNVSFIGTKGEVLTHFLGMNEIYISTGSACSSKKGNSRVLENMKLEPKVIDGAIRFSFGHQNTLDEIDKVVEVLKTSVAQIRKMR